MTNNNTTTKKREFINHQGINLNQTNDRVLIYLPDNKIMSIHINLLKHVLGIEYTPVATASNN